MNATQEIGTRIGQAIARDTIAEDMPREWTGLDAQDGDQLVAAGIVPGTAEWDEAEEAARQAYLAASGHTCPKCGEDTFGRHNGVPVTTGGWHGGLHFAWGRYAGVHMARCTGKRCQKCGYVEIGDPNWD